jgi:hypothetical protein
MHTQQAIQLLQKSYNDEPRSFDFYASMIIAGDQNKRLRQDIVKVLTGEVKPVSKCGIYAVIDHLKANFQQSKLF